MSGGEWSFSYVYGAHHIAEKREYEISEGVWNSRTIGPEKNLAIDTFKSEFLG